MSQRKRMFSAENRKAIMSLIVGSPTGVTCTIGGLEFDLLPFSTVEGDAIFELIAKFGGLWAKLRAKQLTDADILEAIGSEGKTISNLVQQYLIRCGNVQDEEEMQTFAAWYKQLPLVDTIKALVPAAMQANRLTELLSNREATQNPSEGAAAAAAQS